MSLYAGERPEYLGHCLQSMGEQSWLASEIVIVLDGPVGPELMQVLQTWQQSLPIKLVALEHNVGLGRALAHGLEHCSFDIVVRADTDDINQPWRFERQAAFLEHNPHLDLCGSCMWEVDPVTLEPRARKRVPETDSAILAMLPYRNPFNHPSMAFRRSKVLACGNYAHVPMAEDYDLWLRMTAAGCRGWNLQDDLVLARAGAGLLGRRRGLEYVRTEYRLYRTKRKLRLGSTLSAPFVFVARALPRLLPAALLAPVYWVLRRN